MAHNGGWFFMLISMSRVLCFCVLTAVLGLSACETTSVVVTPEAPEGAEQVTRTEANGDKITEYHINGQLWMLYVVPAHGTPYLLYDRGGRPGSTHDNPPQTYFKLFGW